MQTLWPPMIDFLLLLMANELAIIGIWTTTDEGMIFEKPAAWMEKNVTEWITKPLFACPMCMSSFWGTLVWFWRYPVIDADNAVLWALYVLALCGLSKLVVTNLIKW